MKQTAVVILNWNGKSLLERFLPSLLKYTDWENVEIVVADNASTDDSIRFLREHYPEIRLIEFEQNWGFAGGYNRALDLLENEYVVLLNSDVEVQADWLRLAVDYLDTHTDVVALQPKILSYNNPTYFEYAGACGGFLDKYGYPFCRGRVLGTVEIDSGQYEDTIDIHWGSGACLVIRLDEYKKAGGLDERFFAHQEEIDLCWRLRAQQKRIVCLPQSIVHHVGGATLSQEHPHKTYLNFRNNLLMLYKNLPTPYYNKVMRVRWFLDYLAFFQYLGKGQTKNANAVIKARRDFKKLKPEYKAVRTENLKAGQHKLPSTIWQGSVIEHYYIRCKRKYSQFNFNTNQ